MYKCPICYKIMELDDINYIAHCKDCGVSYNLEQINKLIANGVNDGPKWSRPPYYVRKGILTFTIHGIIEANIPEGIIELSEGVFKNREVNSVSIPDTVELIGEEAFMNCSQLEKVYFGSGIKTINKNAFANCSALKEVHIKDIQTWFDIDFEYNYRTYIDTSPLMVSCAKLFVNGKELKHLIVPSGTTLKNIQFAGCSSLETVTIQNNVKIEGQGIFAYCSNLKNVIFEGEIRNTDNLNVPNGCSITSLLNKVQSREQKELKQEKNVDYSKLGEESFKIIDSRKAKGVCQHCGGYFTFFTRKCKFCGKKKDY